jgi:hypothetical protein
VKAVGVWYANGVQADANRWCNSGIHFSGEHPSNGAEHAAISRYGVGVFEGGYSHGSWMQAETSRPEAVLPKQSL